MAAVRGGAAGAAAAAEGGAAVWGGVGCRGGERGLVGRLLLLPLLPLLLRLLLPLLLRLLLPLLLRLLLPLLLPLLPPHTPRTHLVVPATARHPATQPPTWPFQCLTVSIFSCSQLTIKRARAGGVEGPCGTHASGQVIVLVGGCVGW
jgi:hypothetical protein